MGYVFEGDLPCGCTLMDGRCAKHGAMMDKLYAVWSGDDTDLFTRVWAESDGYGIPGEVPPQGYDWSGIRDSSTEAVEAMYAVATK